MYKKSVKRLHSAHIASRPAFSQDLVIMLPAKLHWNSELLTRFKKRAK